MRLSIDLGDPDTECALDRTPASLWSSHLMWHKTYLGLAKSLPSESHSSLLPPKSLGDLYELWTRTEGLPCYSWEVNRILLDDPNPDPLSNSTVPRNQGREAMAYLTYSELQTFVHSLDSGPDMQYNSALHAAYHVGIHSSPALRLMLLRRSNQKLPQLPRLYRLCPRSPSFVASARIHPLQSPGFESYRTRSRTLHQSTL